MDNLYEYIRQIIGKDFTVASILEREIAIADQMEFLEKSDLLKGKLSGEEESESFILELENQLMEEQNEARIKDLLTMLAQIQSPKAFRILEAYEQSTIGKLNDWAYLAMHSLKVKLESFFLEKNAILVSSGLGGKGNKLRYFAAFALPDAEFIAAAQRKIIQNEVYFFAEKNQAEVEEIQFFIHYVSMMILLPINFSIRAFFGDILNSCAELGVMMDKSIVITNMRKMANQEVIQYFNEKTAQE